MVSRALHRAFQQHGVESTRVCFRRAPDADPSTWITLNPSEGHRLVGLVKGCVRLAKLLRSERPDAVLCHTFASSLFVFPLAALAGVGNRVVVHHAPLLRFDSFPRVLHLLDLVFGTVGLHRSIVMVAQQSHESIPGWARAYRRRSQLIPNEIPAPTAFDRAAARHAWDLPDDAIVWAFIGRRTLDKGADVAAAACANSEGAVLLMAGVPGDADPAIASATTAGAQVRLLGQLDRPEVDSLLSAADVLIFPSRHENRPLTLLEASAAGIPVVARDLPEVRTTINGSAVLIHGDDPVAWAEGAETARRAGRSAANLTDATRFDRMVDRYLELLGLVPGPQGRRAP